MDRSQAQEIYRTWNDDLAKVKNQIDDLQKREAGLTKLVEGLIELYPDLSPPSDDSDRTTRDPEPRSRLPRGKEAVTRVLSDHPMDFLTVNHIVEEMFRRNWIRGDTYKPEDKVRTTLGRMRKAGEVERRKRGAAYAYRLKNKLGASSSTPETPSLSLPSERGEAYATALGQ